VAGSGGRFGPHNTSALMSADSHPCFVLRRHTAHSAYTCINVSGWVTRISCSFYGGLAEALIPGIHPHLQAVAGGTFPTLPPRLGLPVRLSSLSGQKIFFSHFLQGLDASDCKRGLARDRRKSKTANRSTAIYGWVLRSILEFG
jgi:hypothetical protein